MLLQLQFIANDIIGLLSQSITSLLKLISMIIHWNHHENTLSWWVFTSQCSSREGTHSVRKLIIPNITEALSLYSAGEQCIAISPQFWKAQCPFPETATWLYFNPQFPRSGNANYSLHTDIVMRGEYWAPANLGPNLSSPILFNTYLFCLLYRSFRIQPRLSVPLFPPL